MISVSRCPCDVGVIQAAPAAQVAIAPAARTRTLAATVLGSSLAFIDGSVVNVALPAIQRDLAAGAAGTQWVMNAYLLVLGALVLIGGAGADRFGRRSVFVAGVGVFTAASVLCALASGTSTLVAARALQGVGAALLVPASLALLGATFPEGERARAIGAWAGYGALATTVGPLLGGFLTDHVSWRAIFYLNVPLAVAAVWLALRGAPDTRSAHPPGLDWLGAILATAALGGVTWGLTAAAELGFRSPPVAAALLVGVAAIVAFVAAETRARSPMLPLALFRSRAFTGANLLTLLLYFALSGVLFFLPFELIRGRGYSATAAGAALLPFPIVMGIAVQACRRDGGPVWTQAAAHRRPAHRRARVSAARRTAARIELLGDTLAAAPRTCGRHDDHGGAVDDGGNERRGKRLRRDGVRREQRRREGFRRAGDCGAQPALRRVLCRGAARGDEQRGPFGPAACGAARAVVGCAVAGRCARGGGTGGAVCELPGGGLGGCRVCRVQRDHCVDDDGRERRE